jgi:hypothetical protein
VGWPLLVSGLVLTAVLLICAVLFVRPQVRLLRGPVRSPDLPEEERRYLRRQAWRRLVGCVLMLLLGVLLLGALLFLEVPSQRIIDTHENPDQRTPDERRFVLVYGWFWFAFLLLLLALVLLAGFELWSVRWRGLRERRQLLADRRAMLEHQIGRLREERNGPGGGGAPKPKG